MKGVEIADPESKYIGLLNDDVFVPGYGLDWLSKMVEYMEEHPNVATVTPMLFHLKNTVFWCGRIPGKAEHLYLHLPKGDPRLPREPFMTESNNMAFCIIRAELLREFRMDDPGVPVHYGSDSAFYNRVQRKYPNMKHFVLPQIQLYHENIYWARTNREDPNISG
jgi:GT2 family glycosyltransferase